MKKNKWYILFSFIVVILVFAIITQVHRFGLFGKTVTLTKPVHIGVVSRPDHFEPVLHHEVHLGVILTQVCGKLFRTSSSLELEPDLVSKWELSKDYKTSVVSG